MCSKKSIIDYENKIFKINIDPILDFIKHLYNSL